MSAHFTEVVDESHVILGDRMESKLTALRRLAGYWRTYGLMSEGEWEYQARSVMEYFPGIVWIAWVPSSGSMRVAAADSTRGPTAAQVQLARARFAQPEKELERPQSPNEPILFFAHSRLAGDSLGIVTAAISPQQMLQHGSLGMTDLLSYSVRGADGAEVFRIGTPAAKVPAELISERDFPHGIGSGWRVRYEPTAGYLSTASSPWPNYFLFTGLLLSLTLGVVAMQFTRLRDTSEALIASNHRLDRQVRELSDRDRELRELNENLEAKIDVRTAELREALRELEAFSHSISHDLRTPIGAVMNFSSILIEDYRDRIDEKGIGHLRRIQASGLSASRLLEQLAAYVGVSRAEDPHVQVNMTTLAREAYHEAVAAESNGHPIRLDMGTLPNAQGDPEQLERVFGNLIRNALKYARPRDVREVQIGGSEGDDVNTYFVADNGIGFDPQLKETIFEPFRRINRNREFEGSGLGLAIVDKIVRKHGGRTWAESDGSTGARFFFTLPRAGSTT